MQVTDPKKIKMIRDAQDILDSHGISYRLFNFGVQIAVGRSSYYPTSGYWKNEDDNTQGNGIESFVEQLRKDVYCSRILSAEDFFEIAKHCKDRSLEGICNAIHAEVYKSKTP